MSKFELVGFLIFILVLCHVTLNLVQTSVAKSRPSVQYWANLLLGRLFDRVDLIRTCVRPSVHKKCLWFQWNLECR